jgi:hypothetical protein
MLYVPGCMKVPEPINNGCKGNAVCKLDRTEPVEPRFRLVIVIAQFADEQIDGLPT